MDLNPALAENQDYLLEVAEQAAAHRRAKPTEPVACSDVTVMHFADGKWQIPRFLSPVTVKPSRPSNVQTQGAAISRAEGPIR